MMPDVEIDAHGDAHIVYTHDPVANPGGVSTTPEDGDIRYITSSGPFFTTWSSPVTVNDDAPFSVIEPLGKLDELPPL